MDVPAPRGQVTAHLCESLATGLELDAGVGAWVSGSSDVADDDDFQLALWMLYEGHYRGFDNVGADGEWRLDHLHLRAVLEERFERWLRAHTRDFVATIDEPTDDFADLMFEAIAGFDSPRLAAYLQRKAPREQMREFLVQRSIYQLKEADPHSWAVPRLVGPAKVALVELLYDEYGSGRPERLHSHLFAATLRECGLDATYGSYLDVVPASTLAVSNAMSMFGLNRRLVGALMGHLAAFEATSSLPARRIAGGLRRLGFSEDAATYYDEHVEADAVHEQVAVRNICGQLVADQPDLFREVMFGAGACLLLDARSAEFTLERWEANLSSLIGSRMPGGDEHEVTGA
ncbi:MAG: iron-containing redox enzyme family protein [Nocardioidaceae bacterium]